MNGNEYCVISIGLYAHETAYLDLIRARLPVYRDAMEIFYPGWMRLAQWLKPQAVLLQPPKKNML
jgi:hypothetical protein